MNNSMEWQVIETNKELIELTNSIKVMEKDNNNLRDKIQIMDNKLDRIEYLLTKLIKEDIKEEELPQLGLKSLTFDTNSLGNNYINRMTNRLWRNSPYITTPNIMFANLNIKKLT